MNSAQQIAYYFTISFIAISLSILCIALIFLCRKKPVRSDDEDKDDDHLPSLKVSAQTYSLAEIYSATDSFSHRKLVGKGRFGTVYAAVFPGSNPEDQKLVAVKRIHPSLVLSNAGFGFSSVLKTLSSAQHPNIVPILGYSQAPGERIVVMEFIGMASLDFHLHGKGSLLDWSRRLRIAAGAARGIEYLHEGMAPGVVHGCVKPSNVLLDVRFCARVCDYGMSFLGGKERRLGVVGYVDDEYWARGACKESDVYGFGVVLLEILSGRRAEGEEEGNWLVKWALPLIKEMRFGELLDHRLVLPSNMKPIARLAKVASACVGNSRKSRPSIGQVATILNSLEVEVCS